MANAAALIQLAGTRVGEVYHLGAVVPFDNANWHGPWDCAEFATWLVFQTTGRLFGCTPSGEAFTGGWQSDARRIGTTIPLEQAAATAGAFLLRPPGVGGTKVGHIALSDGTGATVEAMDHKHGVTRGSVHGRTFTMGVLVPGIDVVPGPMMSITPATPRLEAGDSGDKVRDLQRLLAAAGFDPGTMDGKFGPHTEIAVAAFQASNDLVRDGVVGPKTAAALGLPL